MTAAPSYLSEMARNVWDDVTLHNPEAADNAPVLEAYCNQVARMRDAQARIDAEGLVVADEKGRPIPHPALAIERDAQKEVRAWGNKFGPMM